MGKTNIEIPFLIFLFSIIGKNMNLYKYSRSNKIRVEIDGTKIALI